MEVEGSLKQQRRAKLSAEEKLTLEKKKYGPHGRFTALHFIVLKQRTEDLAEVLKFKPLDLNKADLEGRTPLHLAVNLKTELATLLLDAGANVNVVLYRFSFFFNVLFYQNSFFCIFLKSFCFND
jgi:hypothetical protein